MEETATMNGWTVAHSTRPRRAGGRGRRPADAMKRSGLRPLRIAPMAVATAAGCFALASAGGTARASASVDPSVPATPIAARTQAIFPLITDALENMAMRRATIVFGERFAT